MEEVCVQDVLQMAIGRLSISCCCCSSRCNSSSRCSSIGGSKGGSSSSGGIACGKTAVFVFEFVIPCCLTRCGMFMSAIIGISGDNS
jgi:hypothetical protein